MTKKRKILLVCTLCVLVAVAALSGIGFYYFSNPSKLRALAENALSRFTGTECSIKNLSYTRHPLMIQAKGVQFIEHIQGFYLEIPEISASLSLEGSFGRRSLIFKELQVAAFSLSMHQGWRPFVIHRGTEKPSLLRRILGGLFSFFAFRDVEVREATLEEGHVTGQWEDLRINLNGIRAHLSPRQILELGLGLRIQSDQLDLRIPRLQVITDRIGFPPGGAVKASVRGEEILVKTTLGNVANASMEARLSYRPEAERLDVESSKFSFEGVGLHDENGSRFVALKSLIEARGSLDLAASSLALPSVRAVLGDSAEFKGALHAGPGEKFVLRVAELKAAPRALIPLLPIAQRNAFDSITIDGSVHAGGRLEGNMNEDFGTWTCDVRARLQDGLFTFAGSEVHFETRLSGDIQAKGPLSELETLLTAHGDNSALRCRSARFDRGTMHASLGGTYPAFDVKALKISLPGAELNLGGREIHLEGVEGQASKGTFNAEAKTVQLPQVEVQTSILKNLSLSSEIGEGRISVEAKGQDVHLLELLQAAQVIPPGWKTRSTDALHARADLDADGHLTLTFKTEFQGLAFESPDGTFLGENLSLVVEPTLAGKRGEDLHSGLFLYLREGEVLYDRFYLDFSRHNVTCNGNGRYRFELSSLELLDFRLQLENLAELTASGKFLPRSSGESRLRVHFAKTPLSPLYRLFIVEPYKHQSPLIEALHLRGYVSSDVEMSGQDGGWTVKGRVFWQEGEALLENEGVSLNGVDLDFPLWYEAAEALAEEKRPTRKAPAEIEGALSVRSVELPLLPPQPLHIPLSAAPARMSTTSSLSFKVTGGQVEMGRISLRDPFRGSPELDTRITVKKVDLEPWLSGIWPHPVQGSARGRLDPVRWEGGTLLTKGEITASVFGGRVILSNIGVQRALSLAPVIRLDARWEDLNLAEMTRDTAFGKITGSLRGQVRGLEIANGQPQKFDLSMETVKNREVSQRISVQAVDNIAQIGGGASPFSGLTGAFVSLFKELPYEKIGVNASLENDVFKINGTVKEGGKEYLVKKGGFSGVDVVIGSPGSNTISFKDMVKRIKRVTASHERPVVE